MPQFGCPEDEVAKEILKLVNKFGMSIGKCANITGQSGGMVPLERIRSE